MYDSVTVFCEKVIDFDNEKFSNVKQVSDVSNGEVTYTANIKNMRIKQNYNGIILQGSLSKYYYGNNLFTLSRAETETALQQLSNDLQIEFEVFKDSRVWSFDIATNLLLTYPVSRYLNGFGKAPYYTKYPIIKNETLLYQNTKNTVCVYNKITEIKKAEKKFKVNGLIPSGFEHKNILRIESRFNKRLSETFGKKVKVSNLYNENDYITFIEKHKKNYYNIEKHRNVKLLDGEMNMKLLDSYIYMQGLRAVGIDSILSELKSEYQVGNITKQQYARQRAKIQRIAGHKSLTSETDLTTELNKQFEQSLKYYR